MVNRKVVCQAEWDAWNGAMTGVGYKSGGHAGITGTVPNNVSHFTIVTIFSFYVTMKKSEVTFLKSKVWSASLVNPLCRWITDSSLNNHLFRPINELVSFERLKNFFKYLREFITSQQAQFLFTKINYLKR